MQLMPPRWPTSRCNSRRTTRSRCCTRNRSWISVRGTTGSRADGNRTHKAHPSCRLWSACLPGIPIIPARFTITTTRSRPPTGRSARSPTPTGCVAPFPARATWCTCRATSITAMAVDETYLAANEVPMGVYRLGYYPHNVHFVMASALMAGDGSSGITAAEKLRGLVPDQAALAIPGAHPVKAAPYFAHTLFSPPDTILALPDPGNAIPYVKAMWHYARGIAYVAQRDLGAATAEANAIETLERTADFSLLKTAGIPASDVLKL